MIERISSNDRVDPRIVGIEFPGLQGEVPPFRIFPFLDAFIHLGTEIVRLSREDTSQGGHHTGIVRLLR